MQGDNWFDAKEALKLGLVNEIIPAKVNTVMPVENPEDLGEQNTFNMYASLLTFTNNIQDATNKKDRYMKEKLISKFGLAVTASASDTEVLDAVQAKFDELKQAKKKAEESYKSVVKSIVDQGVNNGTIEKEETEIYMSIGLKSGVEALQTVVGKTSKTPAPNLTGYIKSPQRPKDDSRATWSFDKWQKEDPEGLEKMAENEPEKFEDLFNQKYN